jgi:flagellar basal-body rod protein FlgB
MDMTGLIERALNIRAFYHRVISSNMANVETPGYKEQDIDFRTELDKQVQIDDKPIGGPQIDVKESPSDGLTGLDGNTVNLENQMVKLTENQLMFHSLVQVATKRFSMMKYIIREGK